MISQTYRYILCESFSQFDSLPLPSLAAARAEKEIDVRPLPPAHPVALRHRAARAAPLAAPPALAIIVPFRASGVSARAREAHLAAFVPHMETLLASLVAKGD